MKKLITLLAFVFISVSAFSATLYWVGASGGAWTTASNWNTLQNGSGTSSVPASPDFAIIDADVTITFAGSVTNAINKLTIKTNRTVTFSASTTVIIGSSTAVGWAVEVETGAILNLTKSTTTAAHGVRLQLQTNTFVMPAIAPLITGTINCVEGSGSQVVVLSSTTLTVNGTLELGTNASGHDAGNVSSTGTIVFGPNSTFRNKRTNGVILPAATWDATSTIDWDMPGTTPSITLSGSAPYTFGNFRYKFPNQSGATTLFSTGTIIFAGNVDIVSTGSSNIRLSSATTGTPITINGNLNVSAGVLYGINASSSATVLVKGNMTVASGASYFINLNTGGTPNLEVRGNLDCSGTLTTAGTTATLKMTGSTAQTVKITTLLAGAIAFSPTNTAGVTLLSDITLPRATTIGAGTMLFLGNFNYTVPAVGGIPSAGVTNRIVTNGTGFLKITGVPTTALGATFKIGVSATSYDEVYVRPTNAGIDFSVRVKNSLTNAVLPTNAAFVASREWEIVTSASPGSTELNFKDGSAAAITGTAAIGHYIGGAWNTTDVTGVTKSGSDYSGFNTTGNFSPFAVGNACGFASVAPPTITNLSNNSPICAGASLNFSVITSGGSGSLSYNWTGVNSFTSTTSGGPNPSVTIIPNATTAASGTYNLTITDVSSTCTVTGTTTATVKPAAPTTAVLANDVTICIGQTANLTTTITGGTSPYTVVYSGGTLSGYTSGTNIPVTPPMTTMYTLTSVTDANGCAATMPSGSPTVTVNPLNYTAVASTAWNTASTWSCGVPPMMANVTIPAGIIVALDVNATVNSITFTGGGELTLGANNLTAGTATGSALNGYIVTNGAGQLTLVTAAGVIEDFPIGASTTSYDPLSITPTNGVNVSASVQSTFTNAVADPSKTASREWNISATGAGSSIITLTADPLVTVPPVGTPKMGHYVGGAWNETDMTAVSLFGNTYTGTNASGVFSPFGGGVAGGFAAIVLAVELKSITAFAKGTSNAIQWTTNTEANNSHFNVERSLDGINNWTTIGSQKGKGNSTVESNYSFGDNNPLSISYYRLRSVATNGKEDVSKVVSVLRATGGKLGISRLFPSPASDKVSVDFEATSEGNITAVVTDITGRVVNTQIINAVEGLNRLDLNVAALTSGVYTLTIADKTSIVTQRIVKN